MIPNAEIGFGLFINTGIYCREVSNKISGKVLGLKICRNLFFGMANPNM